MIIDKIIDAIKSRRFQLFLYYEYIADNKIRPETLIELFGSNSWRWLKYQLFLNWMLNICKNHPLKTMIDYAEYFDHEHYQDFVSEFYAKCDYNVLQRDTITYLDELEVELSKYHVFSKERLIEFLKHPIFEPNYNKLIDYTAKILQKNNIF